MFNFTTWHFEALFNSKCIAICLYCCKLLSFCRNFVLPCPVSLEHNPWQLVVCLLTTAANTTYSPGRVSPLAAPPQTQGQCFHTIGTQQVFAQWMVHNSLFLSIQQSRRESRLDGVLEQWAAEFRRWPTFHSFQWYGPRQHTSHRSATTGSPSTLWGPVFTCLCIYL